MLGTQVRSLGQEDPLEKEMTARSSILAWIIAWTEEPGCLQSMGLGRVEHNLATKQQQCIKETLDEILKREGKIDVKWLVKLITMLKELTGLGK